MKSRSQNKMRAFKTLGLFACAIFLFIFGATCSQHRQAAEENSRAELLKLSFKIDPSAQTVAMDEGLGRDAGAIGTITASLSPMAGFKTSFFFSGAKVFIFLKLEGTNARQDLYSIRLQITDLGSKSITPIEAVPVMPGLEKAAGIRLVNGFNSAGLPYYEFGDFYSVVRAKTFNNNSPSNWTLPAAFDLGSLKKDITIKARVIAQTMPQPKNAEADISIQPYLNSMTTSSVIIMWETNQESDSDVFYGKDQSAMTRVAGETTRYQTSPGLGSLRPPTFNLIRHQAVLSGLQPGATYYYQVRSAKTPSAVYHFHTLADHPEPSFTFGVYADTHAEPGHTSVVNEIKQFNPEFLIHAGDLGDGFAAGKTSQDFFQIEQPLLPFFPMFPVHGNHDQFLWYKEYLAMPRSGSSELDGHCYSFRYQNAYFIIVDSELSLGDTSTQFLWLKTSLAKAYSDPNRKFTFVFSHEPFYTGYNHFNGPNQLKYLAPLFKTYDVSAWFAGHVHIYERLEVSGKPAIIAGGGGGSFFAEGSSPDPALLAEESTASGETVIDKYHDWLYHFVMVEFEPDSFKISAYDTSGKTFSTRRFIPSKSAHEKGHPG